jgi:hypothetical protein
MATIERLGQALINADAAGDVEAAKMLASEIRRMQMAETPKQETAPKSEEKSVLGAIGAGLGSGFGSVVLGGQKLLGMGLKVLGATEVGNFLAKNAAEGQARLQEQVAPYKEQYPMLAGGAQLAGEIIPTLPVGGVLAAPLKAAGRAAPSVARFTDPLATAVASGGMASQPNMLVRAAGGGITGGASAALINPEDVASGAAIGIVLPSVGKYILAPATGKVIDAVTGQLAPLRAAKLVREAAGDQLAAVRAAAAAAPADMTAAQAAAGAGRPQFMALSELAAGRDTQNYYNNLAARQEEGRINELARLAGGANLAEARATADQSKAALSGLTTPMRQTELAAANTAGQLMPGLAAEQQRMAAAAANKVEDVRRFTAAGERAPNARVVAPKTITTAGMPVQNPAAVRTAEQQAYVAGLAGKADDVTEQSAEASLRFGDAARERQLRIDSLAAHGLSPLNTNKIIGDISSKLNDPKIGVSDINRKVLTKVGEKIRTWTEKNGGVIDADALYEIRKSAVNDAIDTLMRGDTTAAKNKRAAAILAEVRPLIDDAIEAAGGTGWRDYLKTFATGMQDVEKQRLSAAAMQIYKKNPQEFIDLVRNNRPDLVEEAFGSGAYDFVKQMGAKRVVPMEKVASELERDAKIAKDAIAGKSGLELILDTNRRWMRLPAFMNVKATVLNTSLDILEKKLDRKTRLLLEEGFRSGADLNKLLDRVPAKDKPLVRDTLNMVSKAAFTAATQASANRLVVEVNGSNPESVNNLAP